MILTLPFPDSRLHAHNKGHWRGKTKAVRSLRDLACVIARDAMRRSGHPGWPAACIRYEFHAPDNIVRDSLNMAQSMKPAIDGLADAGLFAADRWQRLRVDGIEVRIELPACTIVHLSEWPDPPPIGPIRKRKAKR